ncbi:MAG: glycine cleavage system protein GcvH [Spirochaetaceae bacterium]|nr:glycine cleavage system protein GcvH [Spirochaetaceae bacterium]
MSTNNLKFSKDHEWIKEEGKKAYIGITDYAQNALGNIVFVELPKAGAKLVAGKAFANIESVKAVSEIFSPISGSVLEINKALENSPELVNEDPYGSWIVLASLDNPEELNSLMDDDKYKEFCKNEKV